MKIVSTWLFDPWLADRASPWHLTVDMLAAMRASANLALRRYGNFTVYTNSLSLPWLREILPNIDIVVSHDDAHHTVPTAFYSWCKLWTWRQQTEEFLHIDLDFLLGPAWSDDNDHVDLMGQWWENTEDPRASGYYNWQQNHAKLCLPAQLCDLDHTAPAINTGCLLVRDISFIGSYVDAVEQLIKDNSTMFLDSMPLTVPTLEQHVLGMLVRKHSIHAKMLIDHDQEYRPINNQFIHFLGSRWKNRELPLSQSVLSRTLDSWTSRELLEISYRLEQARSHGSW